MHNLWATCFSYSGLIWFHIQYCRQCNAFMCNVIQDVYKWWLWFPQICKQHKDNAAQVTAAEDYTPFELASLWGHCYWSYQGPMALRQVQRQDKSDRLTRPALCIGLAATPVSSLICKSIYTAHWPPKLAGSCGIEWPPYPHRSYLIYQISNLVITTTFLKNHTSP